MHRIIRERVETKTIFLRLKKKHKKRVDTSRLRIRETTDQKVRGSNPFKRTIVFKFS